MKKVKIPTNEGIDWSKKQWVINHETSQVVLTTGENSDSLFTGTCMPCSKYPNGDFDNQWRKCRFQHLTFDIPFTISNSNE